MTNAIRFLFALAGLMGLCPAAQASEILTWGHTSYYNPNVPAGLTNAVKLGGGFFHTLALKADGSVAAWGVGRSGAAEITPAGLSNVVEVAGAIYHSLVLQSNGSVFAWGAYSGTNGPVGLSNVVAIAAGGYHNLAIKADGTLAEWGDMANPPADFMGAIAVACGGSHSLALQADGKVFVWGNNSFGQTNMPHDLTNGVAIAAGGNHSVVLKADGQVVAWGNNSRGQTNVPPGLSNVVALAAGNEFCVALKEDGTVVPWGDYVGTNIPGGLTNLEAIVAGGYYAAALTGVGALRIIQQPHNVDAVAGDSPVFRCVLVGRPRASAQWRFNGAPIPSQTNEFLALASVTPDQAGNYFLGAGNGLTNLQSASATLTIKPLVITAQPTNLVVYGGDSAVFEVRARNVGPFFYQWRRDGAGLSGQTNSVLSLTNVSLVQTGSYSAIVSNQYGSVLSAAATLEVIPISILNQPTNRTIYSGESTTFTVSAWKNGPFTYQWRLNGGDLAGQTNATLTLANAATNQSGAYSVLVSNPCGALESSNAVLTVVDSPPLILTQPASQSAWYLGSAAFQVKADGSKPLSYQWRLNGQDIPATTKTTLSLTGLVAAVAGNYSVLVSNPVGTTLSSNAVLTVAPLAYWGTSQLSIRSAPAVTNPVTIASSADHALALRTNGTVLGWGFLECPPAVPAGLSNIAGVAAGYLHNLAVRSNGAVVAWGCNSSGQINVPAGLSNVLAVAAGTAHSLALKADGTVAAWGSTGAAVPASLRSVVALAAGQSFSVALKADGTVTAWGLNTYGQTNVPPGTSNVVAIAAGDYHGLALKTDGSVVSWGAKSPFSYGQTNVPAGLSNVVAIGAGSTHSLAVRSDGTVVAWGRNISGQTNPPVGLSNVFAVVGGDQHSIAQVSADGIALARQPLNVTVAQGKPALLSAAATSSQPVKFQWRHNATNIADATNSWLLLGAAQPADEGSYSVVMSNALGMVTSRDAFLTVTDRPPIIMTQPSSMAVSSVAPTMLAVEASGSPQLKYQWRKDGAAIPAATNSTLTLSSLHRTNSGYYSVVVSNTFGSVLSDEAKLRVLVPQQLGSPRLLTDGNVAISAGDSDGGLLATNDLPFFSVWASTNLVDWEPLPNALTLSNGLLALRDDTATNHPQRFYRIGERFTWRVPLPQRLTEPNSQPGGGKLLMFGESNGERLTPADLAKFQV